MTNERGRLAVLGAMIWVLAWCSPAAALDIPAKHHPWGRFRPASWVRLRETWLAVDAAGKETIRSTSVTTTRLELVEAGGVTLEREVRVDGGEPTTSTSQLGWDELPRDLERTTRLSLGEVKPVDVTYICQTHLVKTRDESGGTTETKWFYCPDKAPYLLKKIARTDGPAARFVSFEVLEFGVPRQVLGQERSAARFSLIENTSERSSKGAGYLVDEVPGGLVEFEAEIRDRRQEGLLQRRRVVIEAFEVAP
ncbi:MAG TPA: hypothetical protein VGX76_23680 [Pirellulales bacterium]|nr:hypothetical protein [Pirellulales bacterium]